MLVGGEDRVDPGARPLVPLAMSILTPRDRILFFNLSII